LAQWTELITKSLDIEGEKQLSAGSLSDDLFCWSRQVYLF